MRKLRVWTAVAVCTFAIALGGEKKAETQGTPNVVVIMADDLDVNSMAALLQQGMLPNIQTHLIDRGYNFTESYVTNALCCPSRATFLTGQYSHNHNVRANFPPVGGVTRFTEATALPVWLKAAGYQTAYIGKYLNGYGSITTTYKPAGWDQWAGLVDPSTYSTYRYKININGTVIDVGALTEQFGERPQFYQTDVLAALTRNFLTDVQRQPFFLSVNPIAPHIELFPVHNECRVDGAAGPWFGNFWGVTVRPAQRHLDTIAGDEVRFPLPLPPSFNEADISDKPAWVQQNPLMTAEDIGCLKKQYWRRLESMRAIDDLVGTVVDALTQTGAMANTVLIFTSDNGFLHGEHRQSEKLAAYDPSIRVPLVIRTPWNTTPRTISKTVLNNDLAPTIAALANAVPRVTVDGRSLLPLMSNPSLNPWRGAFLVEHWNDLAEFGGLVLPPDYFALRTAPPFRRILVRYPTVTTGMASEYYDLVQDPDETQNLILDPSRLNEIRSLNSWLTAFRTCRGAQCQFLELYFPTQ